MIKTKLFTKQKQTLRRRKQAYGYPMGKVGRGMLTKKDLIYSTESCIQSCNNNV